MRSTLNQRLTQLKGLFSWAIMYQRRRNLPVFPNPCDLVRFKVRPPVEPKFIPKESFGDILQTASEEDFLIFSIPLSAGLRVSEMIKLRPQDIKEGRILTIHEPKSGRRVEHAVIPGPVGQRFSRYIQRRCVGAEDKIFWMSRQGAGNIVSRRARKANLSISIHSLRKWCATFWNRVGDQEMEAFVLRHFPGGLRERYVAPLTVDEAMQRQDQYMTPLFEKGGEFWTLVKLLSV